MPKQKPQDALENIRHQIGIVGKQVELLADANTNLDKRDSIDRIINKAVKLDLDDSVLVKSVGMNTAELVKFRMGFEAVALKALSLARELDSELD